VLSSEYCRAAATARLLDLGPVETTPAIMNMDTPINLTEPVSL
jgi:hypothetical protein